MNFRVRDGKWEGNGEYEAGRNIQKNAKSGNIGETLTEVSFALIPIN